jgi:hypothetical protein
MDVNLLKRFDLVQDVNSLYKEMLRNCRNKGWYWHTPSNRWLCIDNLDVDNHVPHELGDYIICKTDDEKWVVEKWMYNS